MAKYCVEDTTFSNIADAIREKTGDTATLTPLAMPAAIKGITGGGSGGSGSNAANAYYIDGSAYSPANTKHYIPIDVSNGTELKFKYDITLSTGSAKKPSVSIKAYKGSEVQENTNTTAPGWNIVSVDANPVEEVICSGIQTTLTGTEVTIDVSDYTNTALHINVSSPSSTAIQYYCRIKVYDIEIN